MQSFSNQQLPEKLVPSMGGAQLDVVEIWDTMQGEGPFVGTPAVFLRLAGCNLQCPMCDTDYTTDRKLSDVCEVIKAVSHFNRKLVVVTGGEPFRQDFGLLARSLIEEHSLQVQVETNGTLYRDSLPWECSRRVCGSAAMLTIVCSPKTSLLNAQLMPFINALKYVVSANAVDEEDGLPTTVLGLKNRPVRPWPSFVGDVYVQPEDANDPLINKMNTDAAVRSCMKYGYRLCLQTHKIVGLP